MDPKLLQIGWLTLRRLCILGDGHGVRSVTFQRTLCDLYSLRANQADEIIQELVTRGHATNDTGWLWAKFNAFQGSEKP